MVSERNDEVYDQLEGKVRDIEAERIPRTEVEMAMEALALAKLFPNHQSESFWL